MTPTVLIPAADRIHPETDQRVGMANILIIDSDSTVARLLVEVARRAGHEGIVAGGPAGGISEREADLLLVDPTAPGALELAAALRRRRPGFPIVTVGADPADPRCERFAPTARVARPFRIAELERALAEALRHEGLDAHP